MRRSEHSTNSQHAVGLCEAGRTLGKVICLRATHSQCAVWLSRFVWCSLLHREHSTRAREHSMPRLWLPHHVQGETETTSDNPHNHSPHSSMYRTSSMLEAQGVVRIPSLTNTYVDHCAFTAYQPWCTRLNSEAVGGVRLTERYVRLRLFIAM